MSLFDWLLVGHLVGDFLLQSDRMAQKKVQEISWMLRHVAVYMLVITVVLVAYGLHHPLALGWVVATWLFLTITHVVLDRRRFVACWMGFAGISPEHAWLSVVADQVFHVLTLAVVAQVLALSSG